MDFKFISAVLILAAFSGCALPSAAPRGGPHEGYDIEVWVDGKQTAPKDAAALPDKRFASELAGDKLWEVAQKISGRPTFEYNVDHEKIGQVTSARAMIEKPSRQQKGIWEPVYSNLSNASEEFQPGFVVQSENYEYAEGGLPPESLPAGTYLVRLYVYGTKSWDAQNIFVNVE